MKFDEKSLAEYLSLKKLPSRPEGMWQDTEYAQGKVKDGEHLQKESHTVGTSFPMLFK
jgi:hypothetical protein